MNLYDLEQVVHGAEQQLNAALAKNDYTFHLRPSRIRELTEELRPCFEELKQDLTQSV